LQGLVRGSYNNPLLASSSSPHPGPSWVPLIPPILGPGIAATLRGRRSLRVLVRYQQVLIGRRPEADPAGGASRPGSSRYWNTGPLHGLVMLRPADHRRHREQLGGPLDLAFWRAFTPPLVARPECRPALPPVIFVLPTVPDKRYGVRAVVFGSRQAGTAGN